MKKNRTIKMCLLGFFIFLSLFMMLFLFDKILLELFGIYLLGLMFGCVGMVAGKTIHTGHMQSNHYEPALDENNNTGDDPSSPPSQFQEDKK